MKYFILIGVVVFLNAAGHALEPKTQLIQTLSIFEPFESHAFHAGHLWVPSNRNNGLGAEYLLTVYDGNGVKVAEKALDHSMRYLYPYGLDSVLTVGVAVSDQLSHYSIVSLKNRQMSVKSWTVPLGAYANEWAGNPSASFFTDPGGLDDDTPIGTALRTLITYKSGRYEYLAPRIRGPHYPVYAAKNLYLIENPVIGTGRYIERVDFNSEKPVRLYQGTNLTNLIAVKDGKYLIAADNDAGEAVLLDTATEKVVRKFPISGIRPKGLAMMGKCLIVATEESKQLEFFEFETGKLVTKWDLAGVKTLYGIRSVAVDEKTGHVFVRSSYPASLGDPVHDRNSVIMAEDSSLETQRICF